MNNIYVLNKSYKKIGTLSNQGANPQAPYYNDLYVQELETGADTYQFSTISSPYTQDLLEIGNHIMFAYKNRNELFTITSLEYSHNEGYKTIGVYAEGIGFDLLEVYMERPEVPEKEEGKDNGGSDKIYIDEDGNIIYDPDGDGETGGDITIDGDGNIIYTPSKNNKKNDSLEFKNISYPTFLKMLLKNSGWSYVCQPGLESVKHDITVKYDTNIYAILQDSMQSYRGVELEFVHEYNGGRVQKVIKAYKDGGRGSFVGKRFEYGTNVKGITKTQEVANSEDDTVLYIDNIGVDVRYDVDFALKSAEVPEIEIGDTHYVVDKDFYPPMTIKARIGKIEVSFSDPTVNKIYLANSKRISGSAIEDEFNEDDIKDIIDDYDPGDSDIPDDPGSGGDLPDHDHNCLKDYNEDSYIFLRHESLPDTYTCPFTGYEYTDRMYLEPDPHGDTYSAIGGTYEPWNFIYGNWVNCKRLTATDKTSIISHNIENSIYVDSLGVRSTRYMVKMPNNRIENATTMSTKDLYDFIKNLTICKYTNKEETTLLDDGNSYTFGVANADKYTNSGDSVAEGIFRKLYDIHNGNPVRVGSGFIENSLLCALIGAFQQHIGAGGSGSGDSSGSGSGSGDNSGGSTDLSDYATISYVDNKLINYATISYVDSKLGSGNTGSSGSSCGLPAGVFEVDPDDSNWLNLYKTLYATKSATIIGDLWVLADPDAGFENGIIHGGRLELTDGIVAGDCDLGKVVIGAPSDSKASRCSLCVDGNTLIEGTLYVEGSYYLNGTPNSDKSLKENIRYIDNTGTIVVDKENLETRDYSKEELLEITDLHDFIVNQINICEYNFINNDRDKIGFIANDYEGTKVGDKIVFRNEETDLLGYDSNNLLFATIGALQEEVRIKDEKIASLEDRLAKIEAMLGINNNDN